MRRKSLLNLSGVDWEDHTGKYPLLYCANIYYGCQHNCRATVGRCSIGRIPSRNLSPWVDRWIIRLLNYMGVDSSFYRSEVPRWAKYVDEKSLRVKWKKELRPYLKSH